MAKKEIKEKAIEVTLWEAANKLRGSVEPAEYKHVVLGLVFLKFASDKFEEHRAKLISDKKEKYIEMADFYNMSNVFFLEEISRWSYIVKKARQNDIALIIDTALHTIEKDNKALKGALPDNYFSRLDLDITKLAALISEIDGIDTLKDKQQDIVGKVYEYFLSKFALAEGKGKGEFYTPKSIVNLITEMIEPYKGIIYDPACGSGGMFVQSIKFIESHHGNKKEVSIYGQEYTGTTYKLAKMNLAIRGIAGNLGEKAADTFGDDQHKDLKADYIMANPPFNQKDWRGANELIDDPRWRGYDVPPKSNANYGWILNMVSKLSENGVAGFILANGALSGGGEEYKIRRKLIENNLVEAILVLPRNLFYTTDISVTLWILNKNKTAQSKNIGDVKRQLRNREKEILFMDLRQMGEPFEKKFTQFSEADIKKVAETFHNWQQGIMINEKAMVNDKGLMVNEKGDNNINNLPFTINNYNVPEYCYNASLEEIAAKDFSLVPSKYIEFVNRDENIDFDEKMTSLKGEFAELLKAEEQSKKDLLEVFKTLGYGIE
jgi:type I restriction enzyme M protein